MPIFRNHLPEIDPSRAHEGLARGEARQEARVAEGLRLKEDKEQRERRADDKNKSAAQKIRAWNEVQERRVGGGIIWDGNICLKSGGTLSCQRGRGEGWEERVKRMGLCSHE